MPIQSAVTLDPRTLPQMPRRSAVAHVTPSQTDPWASFNDVTGGNDDAWSAFDDARQDTGQEPSTLLGDVGKSALSGLAQGVAGLIGLPGDVGELEKRGIGWLADKVSPGSGDKVRGALDHVTVPLPRSEQVNSVISRAVGGYHESETMPGRYANTIASFAPAAIGGEASIPARIARTVAPAVTSQSAGELTAGSSWEPYARVGGALLGGLALPTLPRLAQALGPQTEASVALAAGQRIANSATDPASLPQKLATAPEIVPGSKPTTFQATGDEGLGSLERQVRRQSPEEFRQRELDQNSARLEHFDTIQPGGDALDLTGYLKGKLGEIDAQTGTAVETATNQARQSATGLGGLLGPQEYGSSLRSTLQEANNAAKANERKLWKAVDPDGTLTVSADPIRTAAKEVLAGITPSAKQPSADEAAILKTAAAYSNSMPFQDVGDLRSNVSAVMRQELRTAGQTPAYGRLARLRGAIEDAITGAGKMGAASAGVAEPDAVAEIGRGLQQQAAKWAEARRGSSQGFSSAIANGAGRVSTIPGTASPVRGRLSDVASAPGLPSQPFNPDAAERLRLATSATRERAETFGAPPLSTLLKKAGGQGQYHVGDSSVAPALFKAGPKSFDAVTAYRKAAGDPKAMETLQDYAASALRKAAIRADGTLDPVKSSNWVSRHADALRAFPDLKAKFQNAKAASQAIAEAAANRKAALDTYQTGALGKITGLSDPGEVQRVVGGILSSPTGVTQMRQLAGAVAKSSDAKHGLRKAVVDYMRGRVVNTNGEMRSQPFQSVMKQNAPALRVVFSDAELKSMSDIVDDLQRTDRSKQTLLVPRGLGGDDQRQSVLRKIMAEAGGMMAGAAVSHTPIIGPAIGWLGVKAINAFRDAGISRVDDLVREAMLHPEVARALVAKVPAKTGPSFGNQLAAALARTAVVSGARDGGRQ